MSGKPRVTFLNHSCIAVSSASTTILCDPWFTGAAFDNGWRLLVEESHNLGALEFDYLWLSHEHPDHFSIPTLRQMTKPMKVIYQTTEDQKVKAFLSRQHEVTEIAEGEKKRFGDIDCRIFMSDGYDSAMLFTLPGGETVLNLNDCRAEMGGLAERIAAQSGPIDLLCVQFSYANWAGNKGDGAIPEYQHEQVRQRLEKLIETFKPRAMLLFASYVFFSHEENFFWNEHFWLSQMVEKLGPHVQLIVPKPDDVVTLADIQDTDFTARNEAGIAFWTARHRAAAIVDRAKEGQSLEQLRELYAKFQELLWRENDLDYARATSRGPLYLTVRVTDLSKVITFELLTGAMDEVAGAAHDVELSSETLAMLLKSKFGRGTVTINGRVQFNYVRAHQFFAFFFVFYANNIGRYLKPGGLSWSALRSIQNTSVLESIFHERPEAKGACTAFLDNFIAPATARA